MATFASNSKSRGNCGSLFIYKDLVLATLRCITCNIPMAPKAHPRILHSYHYLPWKSPTSKDTSTSYKNFKTLVQDHILPHVCNVVRALSKAKSIVMDLGKWKSEEYNFIFVMKRKKSMMMTKKKKKKKSFSTSIRMCCNWHSSHVLPTPEQTCTEGFEVSHVYYDSTWNSAISTEEGCDEFEPQLSGYLHWLEEKMPEESMVFDEVDEIDSLAEMFIAKCHEKFRLEKQESYRRYQEMLVRSM